MNPGFFFIVSLRCIHPNSPHLLSGTIDVYRFDRKGFGVIISYNLRNDGVYGILIFLILEYSFQILHCDLTQCLKEFVYFLCNVFMSS
ncbi:hypothetical protein GDO86_005624 [Hymenochirus boettgeri]|uniref:Uncharacterized protein n=1 Tax=Hymenochirus boettgeri TaxID=247094 RepID=A0A8T2J7Q8_9PIPI|nr:hypothetical protein GDO86_005624 [Hymenochirus boettgeri]